MVFFEIAQVNNFRACACSIQINSKAVMEGLWLGVHFHISSLIIDTDSLYVFSVFCRKQTRRASRDQAILKDCFSLVLHFCNAADFLANLASSVQSGPLLMYDRTGLKSSRTVYNQTLCTSIILM